jgi:hypothetical protein
MTPFDEDDVDFTEPPPVQPPARDRLRWQPVFTPNPNQARPCNRPEATGRPAASRLPRIVAGVLLLGAVLIGIAHRGQITTFLSTMANIGPGHTREDQTVGLIAVGLICVAIVAVVRILANDNRHDSN